MAGDEFEQDATERACAPMLYFSHDSNAMNDTKMKRLYHRCGWDGIGRWWHVCEMLAIERGHTIHFETDEDRAMLSDELGLTDDECASYIATLSDVGLIDQTMLSEGRICSRRMMDNALRVGARKAAAAKGGKAKRDNAMAHLAGDST